MPSEPLNAALKAPMALEAAWLGLGGSFPFGLSVMALARCDKPAGTALPVRELNRGDAEDAEALRPA
jgi:hypothetical protein